MGSFAIFFAARHDHSLIPSSNFLPVVAPASVSGLVCVKIRFLYQRGDSNMNNLLR